VGGSATEAKQDYPATGARSRVRDALAAAALACIAFAAFSPAIDYKFVGLDDPVYVSDNPLVTRGLSREGFVWAFTTFRLANWHPLTWLSLQLDATLFAPGPAGFHRTNVFLHAANVALVFLALRGLTARFWPSVAVALLFGVHPLRVESVAWVSERKDVLSIFFGLLALWAYAGYARTPSVARYASVFAAFLCSLLSKSMLVTLPCLMLVLDWWPLARDASWRRLVVEKLPLFALALAISVVTVQAQESRGARKGLDQYPLSARVENAMQAYTAYLTKTAWPAGLAIFYPHPLYPGGGGMSHPRTGIAALLLAAVTVAAILLRRRAPYLLAGWLWYVGTLVPVIGLVQVGSQACADRYSYFPQIGVLLAVCWTVADVIRGGSAVKLVLAGLAALALVCVTLHCLPVWQDSLSLWQNARRVSGDNALTLTNLGGALEENGNATDAEELYRQAAGIDPDSVSAHQRLGELLYRHNRLAEAAAELERAANLAPTFALVRTRLGSVYYLLGRLNDAAREHQAAIDAAPGYGDAYFNLAVVEMKRNRPDLAVDLYRSAVRLQPNSAEALCGLGVALRRLGQRDEGMKYLRMAVNVNGRSAQAWHNLGTALREDGDARAADECLKRAGQLDPRFATSRPAP
jgi:tetratricopeptide (TPR) repeat protein